VKELATAEMGTKSFDYAQDEVNFPLDDISASQLVLSVVEGHGGCSKVTLPLEPIAS
jgi:hypothetical protein